MGTREYLIATDNFEPPLQSREIVTPSQCLLTLLRLHELGHVEKVREECVHVLLRHGQRLRWEAARHDVSTDW